jgi:putative membrane protein
MIGESPQPIDRRANPSRDQPGMAEFNTKLALDRTMLAWVRTALTMASFGFGMVAFFRSRRVESPNAESRRLHEWAVLVGTSLLVLAILAMVLAGVFHWYALRKLRRGEGLGFTQWPLSVLVALLFAVIGLAGLVALFRI